MRYRKSGFKVGLDVDDVLLECVNHAIRRCNDMYEFEPPLRQSEVTQWGKSGKRTDVILDEFEKEEFYETQPLIEGAQEFVEKLLEVADVYFVTAIKPECMGIRAKQLLKYFPNVPADHIIMTTSKEMVHLDVLLDDGGHNIINTKATYPVLFRRPWNQYITGTLAVNNYEEFFVLIEEIKTCLMDQVIDTDKPMVIALVGPSGSGKSLLAKELTKENNFGKPVSFSTRMPRPGEINGLDYNFIDKKKFDELVNSGEIFERTVYAGEFYGTSKMEVQKVLDSGKNVVIPIDMCGAMGIKNNFKNSITIFIERRREDILKSIIERDVSVDDKVKRIVSINAEVKNKALCDFVVNNYSSIEDLAKQVKNILK